MEGTTFFDNVAPINRDDLGQITVANYSQNGRIVFY